MCFHKIFWANHAFKYLKTFCTKNLQILFISLITKRLVI